MAFEGIDVGGPDPAEGRQPGVDLLQRFGLDPVQATLSVHGGFNEAGLAQHAEMLRDARLRHSQLTLDLAD